MKMALFIGCVLYQLILLFYHNSGRKAAAVRLPYIFTWHSEQLEGKQRPDLC